MGERRGDRRPVRHAGSPGRTRQELADVFIYLVRLADVTGVDLLDAAATKIAANAAHYPADEVHGSSAKRER